MKFQYIILLAVAAIFGACTSDLNVTPLDEDQVTSENVYDSPESYKQVLAKLYGGLSLTGQVGPDGNGDIAGIDEGFSSYLRNYFYHQEFTTDEALIAWNDRTIKDFHDQDWSASDIFVQGMYSRIYYQIVLANELIRSGGGNSDATIQTYVAEARFLRALSYYHALDLFGSVPFVTEADEVGAFLPSQISRANLFDYIETELLDLVGGMVAVGSQEYGRADQGAAWMLLAKLYMNAEVYTGTDRYADALTYINNVINAGYSLHSNYDELFMADNDTRVASEVIFAIPFDGLRTQTWGGTTFIVHAAVGGNMAAGDYGIDGGWNGMRTTSALVNKFADPSGATDTRANFFTNGQNLEIEDVALFTDGYAVTKFTNKTSANADGQHVTFVDTDFPVFRLADAYLMYAEAVLRGAGGDATTALGYVNDLRERAYGNTDGNITSGDLDLDFILDERARELHWECHRRTDLIRFGKFSESDYVWPWKGGVAEGVSTDSRYDVFPIPSADIAANPNLTQNTGY